MELDTDGQVVRQYAAVADYFAFGEIVALRLIADETSNQLFVLYRTAAVGQTDTWNYFLMAHDMTTLQRNWMAVVGPSHHDSAYLDLDATGKPWVARTWSGQLTDPDSGNQYADLIMLAAGTQTGA